MDVDDVMNTWMLVYRQWNHYVANALWKIAYFRQAWQEFSIDDIQGVFV